MSHLETNIHSTVSDLNILERTLQEKFPGMTLIRDKKEYAWYGSWQNDYSGPNAAMHTMKPEDFGKCDHCIELAGCEYSIGLVPVERDGIKGWAPVLDFWGPGRALEVAVGRAAEKLMTEYARMTAVVTAEEQGMILTERQLENGELEMLLTRY